jgi:crossover junction endodeoxyribonuclease RusA
MLTPEPRPELIEAGCRITIDVTGTPAPQGSKAAFVDRRGKARTKESSRAVRPWRNAVIGDVFEIVHAYNHAHPDNRWQALVAPVRVQVRFYTRRPHSHYGTGRNAGVLKPTAPRFVTTTPDLDKLLRSTFDGLKEAGVYRDDSLVVKVIAEHLYANQRPGAFITVDIVDDPGANLDAYR